MSLVKPLPRVLAAGDGVVLRAGCRKTLEECAEKFGNFVDGTLADITFDASYPTGGYAVAASDFGLDRVLDTVMVNNVTAAGTRLVAYDPATKKLKIFTALSTEASNASDQSAIVARVVAIGK